MTARRTLPSMHADEQQGLSEELTSRARSAAPSKDLLAALELITTTIVELGIADGAGVSERIGGEFIALAATDDRARTVDVLQHKLDEGPCVQAFYEDGLLSSGDLTTDDRWPRWGRAAADQGIHAVISVNLYTVGSAIGALNLFSNDPREYTTDDLETAKLLGVHASVVLARFRADSNLWRAIDSRHRIGLAQGMLMERFKFGPEQAFAVLRRYSQQQNTKLHLIADHIVATGQLPEVSPSGMPLSDD